MGEKIETEWSKAEWSKTSKEADKFNPLRIGDPLTEVFQRAPVHFRDEPNVTATMLESQRNIHGRT